MTSTLARRWDATFEALMRDAARSYPKAEMSPDRTSFEALDAAADHDAARWREAAAPYGGRTALIVVPTVRSFAAILGGLRAGLALSLVPPEIDAGELDAAIVSARCTILAGPAHFAGLAIGDLLVQVAADQERIALVATHGGHLSGVLPLDGARETKKPYETRSVYAEIGIAAGQHGIFARFDESQLIEAARSVVAQAGIRPGDTILTTLSLASAAGLAAGPLAALIAGARLIFHCPFETRGFVAALEAAAPAHLVAPEAFAPALRAAGLITPQRISSLILSCAEAEAAPALARAPADAPTVLVRLPLWGGVSVETAAAEIQTFGDGGDGRAA